MEIDFQCKKCKRVFDCDVGAVHGECQACEQLLPVNDLGLCDECAGKLERDLIRGRDWDYSVTSFGLDPSKREEVRRQVIEQYGERYELIAPPKEKKNRRISGRQKKGKSKGRNR